MSVCVRAIADNLLPGGLETSVKEGFANIGIPLEIFGFWVVLMVFCVLNNFFVGLLCIMGKLSGEGFVAVAFSGRDK